MSANQDFQLNRLEIKYLASLKRHGLREIWKTPPCGFNTRIIKRSIFEQPFTQTSVNRHQLTLDNQIYDTCHEVIIRPLYNSLQKEVRKMIETNIFQGQKLINFFMFMI